jgi:ribonuclease-3
VLQDRGGHRPAHHAGAWGRNKKEAEQKAAMNALAQINGDPVPFEAD